LDTFLKTQRPTWDALPSVIDELKEQKRKLNAWKEDLGRVIHGEIEQADTSRSNRKGETQDSS